MWYFPKCKYGSGQCYLVPQCERDGNVMPLRCFSKRMVRQSSIFHSNNFVLKYSRENGIAHLTLLCAKLSH